MIFKGMTFRRSETIAFRDNGSNPYVGFYYRRTGEDVELTGHSLTNMAYAKDGRVLLAKNGQVYTSPKVQR